MGPQNAPHTPTFMIYKGNENITANLENRALLISVQLGDGNGEGDHCQITVDDRDYLLNLPSTDEPLQIWLGYKETGVVFMGTFNITALSLDGPPASMTLIGDSTPFRGPIKSKIEQQYEKTTLGGVVNKIAGDLGMTAVVDGELAGIDIPYLNENGSRMQTLQNLERLYGGFLSISDGKISLTKRDGSQTAGGGTQQIIQLGRSHVAQYRVMHRTRGAFSQTVAKYKDATGDDTKFATAQSRRADKVLFNDDGSEQKTTNLMSFIFPTQSQAEAAARAQQDALDRTLGEAEIVLWTGDPAIRPQNKLILSGFRDGIDATYVVALCAHSYGKETGLTSTITTVAPSGSESASPLPYYQDPATLAPADGQTVLDLLATQGNSAASNPAAPPPVNSELGGRRNG